MKVFIVSCVLLSVVFAQEQAPKTLLHECFEQDSIACVQNTVYRQAREFFNQPTIKLFGGVAFAKTNERAGKALAPEVEQAGTVQAREIALEGYLAENVKSFFTDRQLTWDLATAGRSLANAIPEDVKETVRELVVEGRTKKKILKKLVPILGLVKLKALGLAVLTVAAIGLLAKKALITSFIAIAIASASALSSIVAKLFSLGSGLGNKSGGLGGLAGAFSGVGGGAGAGVGAGGYNNAQVEEYIVNSQSAGNGWPSANSGWSNSYDHEHGAYSQPIGQAIAYSGHKANRR